MFIRHQFGVQHCAKHSGHRIVTWQWAVSQIAASVVQPSILLWSFHAAISHSPNFLFLLKFETSFENGSSVVLLLWILLISDCQLLLAFRTILLSYCQGIFLNWVSILVFGTFAEIGAQQFGEAKWPAGSRDPPVSVFPVLWLLPAPTTIAGFWQGCYKAKLMYPCFNDKHYTDRPIPPTPC